MAQRSSVVSKFLWVLLVVAILIGGVFIPSMQAQAGDVGLFESGVTHCHAKYIKEGQNVADAVEFIFTDGWCRAKYKEGGVWYYAVQNSVHYQTYNWYETPTPTLVPTRTPAPATTRTARTPIPTSTPRPRR